MRLCRALLLLGLAVGTVSMYETLAFTWNPLFEAPVLPQGRRHTNYHAFRGFSLSVGVALVLCWGMFQPVGRRRRELWGAMVLASLGYYVGWWLPWPLFGLRTPSAMAEGVHALATALTLSAVFLSRSRFRD